MGSNDFRIKSGTLTSYKGNATEVIVPEEVTKIGNRAFYQKDITKVTLPAGVKEIGDYAFYQCPKLESIQLPEGLEEIGDYSFYRCEALQSIQLPEGLEEIGDSVFQGCSSLKSVKLPESIEEIGENAFNNCGNLTSINIPDGLKELGEGSFIDCVQLDDVIISEETSNRLFFNKPILKKLKPELFAGLSAAFKENPEENHWSLGKDSDYFCSDDDDDDDDDRDSTSMKAASPWYVKEKIKKLEAEIETRAKEDPSGSKGSGGGCYIATAVYGSYDCPPVWTLRRFRDNYLAKTMYGRTFIRTYYAISPKLVRWFGHTDWFRNIWLHRLNRLVDTLQKKGYDSSPYND